MELPIYDNLKDFRDNYIIDFSESSSSSSYIKYLKTLEKKYSEIVHLKNYQHTQLNLKYEDKLFNSMMEDRIVKEGNSFLLSEVEMMELMDSDESVKEIQGIFDFIKDELRREEVNLTIGKGANVHVMNEKIHYSNEIVQLATEVFSGDLTKLELLKYFNDNFNSVSKRFTDLTKYNQVYFFLQGLDTDIQIPKNQFKLLIKTLFGFDYGNAEVKGVTEKHQRTLGHYYIAFKESDS